MRASYASLPAEELVKACVGSDGEAAWAEFVRRFRPVIAKVVLRVTSRWTRPHPHLLDDLIQDTFLKLCSDNCVLLRRFKSRHQGSIYGFVKVVAASVVCDHFKFERAQKRDVTQTDSMGEWSRGGERRPRRGSCEEIEARVALREVDEALCKLFPGENLARNRAIFWLHNREGMTASAIASIPCIGLQTKGVESKLRRMADVIQSHVNSNI